MSLYVTVEVPRVLFLSSWIDLKESFFLPSTFYPIFFLLCPFDLVKINKE